MLGYTESLKIIEEHLKEIASQGQPAELYAPIRYLLSMGGKRIRPCLAIMAHSLFTEDTDTVIDAATGIEVFHNFTLMHDDIMDNAVLRRNYETVHVKWNNNVAILSGDAMLILAYQFIAKSRKEHLLAVLDLFNKTALQVCEGQQYDMNYESSIRVSVDEYLKMIRLKTAVLLAASLAAGGITAGASREDIDALYQFGINIGIAFQLQDDYLDVFADKTKFGKSIGGDIVANKKTFLLLNALQSNNRELVSQLESWMNNTMADKADKIDAVKSIYEKLDIGTQTLRLSEEYFNQGLKYLNKLDIPTGRTHELKEFVTLLIRREK